MGCEQSTPNNAPPKQHRRPSNVNLQKAMKEPPPPAAPVKKGSMVKYDKDYNHEIDNLLNPRHKDAAKGVPPNGVNKGVPGSMGAYDVVGYLGKGSWAVVHQVIERESGKKFAIKSFNKKKISRNDLDYTARREIRLLKELKDHPNIVGLRDVVEDRVWLHMVVDVGGRDVQDIVDKTPMVESQAKKAFRDLMVAVKYIHDHGVCHRDLKPSNLLIGGGKLMLTDFGLGEHISKSKPTRLHEVCGTPDFIPPEINSSKGYDGCKADIWSCGITLYVLVVGRPPWTGSSSKFKQKQIAKGDYKSPKLSKYSAGFNDILEQMLQIDPTKRPTASGVLNHKWLGATVYL